MIEDFLNKIRIKVEIMSSEGDISIDHRQMLKEMLLNKTSSKFAKKN